MKSTTIMLLGAISIFFACSDAEISEISERISPDVQLESLSWVEDKTKFSVSLFDTQGNLIQNPEEMHIHKEYDLIIEGAREVAIYVNKSFGFEFLENPKDQMLIADSHTYRIMKTEPGFNQIILEVFPLHYLENELIHERPRLFMLPKKSIE